MLNENERHFGAVIIDFPWPGFGVESHYATMSNAAIVEMAPAIRNLLADNAMVFLWVANSNLIFGHEVLAAMGARYSSTITWAKSRIGRGRPLRSSTEHILVGLIGKPVVNFRGQGTWFYAPVQDPSHKPEEFHAIVERLTPGPYLELFARRPHQGWSVWGNELARSDIQISGYSVPGEYVVLGEVA